MIAIVIGPIILGLLVAMLAPKLAWARGLEPATIVFLVLVAASETVAIVCVLWLWRHDSRWMARIGWPLVLIIPFLGPTLYGALYGRAGDDKFPEAPRDTWHPPGHDSDWGQ